MEKKERRMVVYVQNETDGARFDHFCRVDEFGEMRDTWCAKATMLAPTYMTEPMTRSEALIDAWAYFNKQGDPEPWHQEVRSAAVGDVFTVDGYAYEIRPAGFAPISHMSNLMQLYWVKRMALKPGTMEKAVANAGKPKLPLGFDAG